MSKRPLVQRLRENPNFAFWLDIAEAADRIEELEAENKRLIEMLKLNMPGPIYSWLVDEMNKVRPLEAEVERLRKALEGE